MEHFHHDTFVVESPPHIAIEVAGVYNGPVIPH
jgi:hypothetical protein